MPEPLTQQPAIGARARGIRLGERPLGKILLRGDPGDRIFMAAVGRALDLLLPGEPNSTAARGELTALWLGPDAWFLTCPPDDDTKLAALREALHDVHAAVTDVSDGRVALRLAGPDAREVLAKGCPLDLHPSTFPPGSCGQSLVAKASVVVHLLEDDAERGPSFDLHVARSFAHYLWAWLEDAGREYGVQIGPAP